MSRTRLPQRTVTPVWFVGFLSLLLLLIALLQWSEATRKIDRLLHDSWVRFNQRQAPHDLVIVAIDPDSLATIGRWPWPREVQTRLFRRLADADFKAVIVDMLFVEPSRSPEVDLALGAAIGALPKVVLPVLTEQRLGRGEKLPIPAITGQVNAFGHIVLPIDDDGIVRRVRLKAGYRRAHWPALALAAWQHLDTRFRDDRMLPGRRLPASIETNDWVGDYEVWIPFYGPSGSFSQVPAASVLDGSADLERYAGAVALVGITALGLTDLVPTPVSALARPVPGVEIHANIMAGLRDGTLVTQLDQRYALLAGLVVLPLLLVLYSRSRASLALIAAVGGSLVPVLASFVLYRAAGLWFAPLSASVAALVSYLLWSWHRLDFVNRFLERESRALEPHLPRADDAGDASLVAFFEHACTHLPIRGWSVRIESRLLHGKAPLELEGRGAAMVPVAGWSRYGDVYRKRYGDVERLQIRVRIADAGRAPDILAYIDSLARVRRRAMPTRPVGSIERLQDTALKLAEQTAWLRSVKVFSETVMSNSPAGFGVWNPAGELLRCNNLLLDMVPGLTDRPLLYDFMLAIGAEPSSHGFDSPMSALILEGTGWQTTRSDGEIEQIINFTASGEHLIDRLITVVVLDVSALRSVEQARAEMVDYLSHDLRSPLISALYLLDDEADAALSSAERSRQLERHISHSLAMMDELLHVARADSLVAEDYTEVLFNAVVDNAADHLVPQAHARQVRIDLDLPHESLWLIGDAASLERAVVNVLGNALKYSPAGSRVAVLVRVLPPVGELQGGPGGTVELSVSDAGPGIDPAIKDTLFQRFRRDQRTAGQYQGMGLGLALVARVVQQHGGEVFADNLDPGTRVTMRLPLQGVSGVNE